MSFCGVRSSGHDSAIAISTRRFTLLTIQFNVVHVTDIGGTDAVFVEAGMPTDRTTNIRANGASPLGLVFPVLLVLSVLVVSRRGYNQEQVGLAPRIGVRCGPKNLYTYESFCLDFFNQGLCILQTL